MFRARRYSRKHLMMLIKVALVMNTPSGKGARTDEGRIRAAAVQHGVPCITTIQAADAAVMAMEALRGESMNVQALQDRFPGIGQSGGRSVEFVSTDN